MARPEARDARRVLRERARALARAPQREEAAGLLEVLVFSLGQEAYAVEMHHVREVVALKDLTPVPCVPRFVLGIINVRGEICPVIDLKRLFGLPERGLTNAARAVIVRDGALELGILADVVAGARAVPAASIAPPPPTLAGIQAEFLRGVAAEGLIVLDGARVLAHPSMIVREQAEE